MELGDNLGFVIKIIIYMIVVRVIMSKIGKKSKSSREGHKTNSRQPSKTHTIKITQSKGSRQMPSKTTNFELKALKDLISKDQDQLGPMGRMAKREKELEKYLSRKN